MNVIEGKVKEARRIVLYGVDGVGKSTWAASAPHPIFVPTEDGLKDIDCHHYAVAPDFDTVMKNLQEVYEARHTYKTLVVDSLDWLQDLIWREVATKEGKTDISEIGYQKGYDYALSWWRKFLDACDMIRQERGMTVILVAHGVIVRFQHPELEDYDRWAPALHKHASNLIRQWADEVFFATYKTYGKEIDKGFGQKRTKPIGGRERVIKTQELPAYVAKNRLNLPEELPLKWSEYAKFLEPVKPEKKANGKPEPKKEEVKANG